MKRDNDLIRALLLEMEAKGDFRFDPIEGTPEEDIDKRIYHLKLLGDAGYVAPVGKYSYRLTNHAHDFIEAMRDEGIWNRTKDAVAKSGGNATLDIIKQIAVGFLKKQIRDRTGVD
ncbi:MAG: DUF2513 domain-containing protein, partial [Nocardiopsis sp. BM-2018]